MFINMDKNYDFASPIKDVVIFSLLDESIGCVVKGN